MKIKILYLFIFFALISIGQFFFEHSTAQQKPLESSANVSASIREQTANDETFNRLISTAEKNGTARVIIGVLSKFTPEGRLGKNIIQAQRLSIKQSQKEFLSRVNYTTVKDVRKFEYNQ